MLRVTGNIDRHDVGLLSIATQAGTLKILIVWTLNS